MGPFGSEVNRTPLMRPGSARRLPYPDVWNAETRPFVVRDNRSPTDRLEHFNHPNGAVAFQSIWIATDAREELARLLVNLGGARSARTAAVPEPSGATVVSLDGGDVVVVPGSHQRVVGRPVIGASVLVRDLDVVRRHLAMAGIEFRHDAGEPRRVVVAPTQTHGIWLEFLKDPAAFHLQAVVQERNDGVEFGK